MVDQAIALGVDGIIINMVYRVNAGCCTTAVDAGIKVVAFDVNVENPKIPQVDNLIICWVNWL